MTRFAACALLASVGVVFADDPKPVPVPARPRLILPLRPVAPRPVAPKENAKKEESKKEESKDALSVPVTDPNPAKLAPTAEQTTKAELLVAMLGSDIYRERDKATRELEEMGRLALAVIDRTLAETGNAEVRTRCEALRPAMAELELKARLECLFADAEGKYDHKLPGWDKFSKITGKTAMARKLFSEMYENTGTARLLVATSGPKEELTRLTVERRIELYNRLYGRRSVAINGVITTTQATPPTAAEVAGLLFAEGLAGSAVDRRYIYAIQSMVIQSPTRDLVIDEAKGEALRKLIGQWCDTRTDTTEQYYAMTMSANLFPTNLTHKDLSAVKYALRILDGKNVAVKSYRSTAITTLAKAGKDQLPHLLKFFDDKTVYLTTTVNANGMIQRTEMQIRDLALAMAILLAGEKPEDYGFTMLRPATETTKFHTNLYRLTDDEKRTSAFKKWEENHPTKK